MHHSQVKAGYDFAAGVQQVMRAIAVLCLATFLVCARHNAVAADADESLQGVYKRRFKILAFEDPDEPQKLVPVTDTVVVIRLDASHIYFSADLYFDNFHQCGIGGIAKRRGPEFVLEDDQYTEDGFPPCRLKISGDERYLRFTDDDNGQMTCKHLCGARGYLTDFEFKKSSRIDPTQRKN